jgi:hypothetical protein
MILSIHLNRGGKKCFAFKERSRLERCSPYWPDVNEKEEEEKKSCTRNVGQKLWTYHWFRTESFGYWKLQYYYDTEKQGFYGTGDAVV